VAILAASIAASACSSTKKESNHASPETSRATAVRLGPIALPSGRPDGRASRLGSRREVPLEGPRVEAVSGDILLRGRRNVAVVSSDGRVIDFGAPFARDALGAVEPTVASALTPLPSRPLRVVLLGERGPDEVAARSVYVERESPEGLRIHAFIYFDEDTLVIETTLSAANPSATHARALSPGLRLAWGNVPTVAPGIGELREAGAHLVRFVAREASLPGEVGHAVAADAPLRVVVTRSELPGFHSDPIVLGAPLRPSPDARAPNERRVFRITAEPGPAVGPVLRAWQASAGTRPLSLVAPSSGFSLDLRAEIACGDEARADPPRPTARILPQTPEVPRACTHVRLVRDGHASGPWTPITAAARASFASLAPRAGTLVVVATERGRPIPARLFVESSATGPGARQIFHERSGRFERSLAPGRYRIVVDRGFEYSRHEAKVDVVHGRESVVRAPLERVVDTSGYLSADLHLHAEPSPDAPTTLEARVSSVAAAGVEVAVATDHNAVTDYAPVVSALGLAEHLATVVGDEVTTKGQPLGHFNVFPLQPGAAPLPFLHATPPQILAAARTSLPFGPRTLVQLNHPRMGELGYFDLLAFDPANVRAFPKSSPLATLDFDAIEVFNGDHYDDLPRVETCLRDFLALVSAGLRLTATGNSDSHVPSFHEAGVPRTYIAMPSDSPRDFDLQAFVASLRAGRAVVSSGPFVRLEASGRGPGARLRPGPAIITLAVSAPAWVDVSEVELWRRGAPWKAWRGPFREGVVRLRADLRESLTAGDHLMAFARGRRPMDAFYRKNALPFAFTNPIYVDPPREPERK
jgi:hypothetical protein